MSYRFRTGEKGELVLQVSVHDDGYHWRPEADKWRDATVSDIPVADPFRDESSRVDRPQTTDDGVHWRFSP